MKKPVQETTYLPVKYIGLQVRFNETYSQE